MIARHRSDERTAGERGRAFGEAHRPAIANTVAVYRRLLGEVSGLTSGDLRALGARVGADVARRWPDLVEELEGMAAGSGQRVDELVALNARTELLGGRTQGECSVIGTVGDGEAAIAQTWDWHPDLAPSRVVWTVVGPDGRWHATLTEAGILAKLGVSSARLACGLNFLTTSEDGGIGGTPIHVLLRVVLDRCRTLTEALGVLTGATVTASSCVTLAGVEAAGAAALAVELSPGGADVVWPDRDGLLVHANHFRRPPGRGFDTQPRDHPSSLLRQFELERRLAAGAPPAAALRSHFPSPESVCRHASAEDAWCDRRATLAAVVLDPGALRFELAEGPPCERPFEPVALP